MISLKILLKPPKRTILTPTLGARPIFGWNKGSPVSGSYTSASCFACLILEMLSPLREKEFLLVNSFNSVLKLLASLLKGCISEWTSKVTIRHRRESAFWGPK